MIDLIELSKLEGAINLGSGLSYKGFKEWRALMFALRIKGVNYNNLRKSIGGYWKYYDWANDCENSLTKDVYFDDSNRA